MTTETQKLTIEEIAAKVLECITTRQTGFVGHEPGWKIEPHQLQFELKLRFSVSCSSEELFKACALLTPNHISIKISELGTPYTDFPKRPVVAFEIFRRE